jgi:hypothetical protein
MALKQRTVLGPVYIFAVVIMPYLATALDGWQKGRATNYGGPSDPWSIMDGSCQYGFLDPKASTGWDVAAVSDTISDFKNSCGTCYEVKCDGYQFKDNYGQTLDRSSGVCFDSDASVVVQVTDSCPCDYPSNAYSNKRWCCGDMFHFDLSIWSFEKLADTKWGVIGVQYRRVPCTHRPDKQAVLPGGRAPARQTREMPGGGYRDRRPA